MNDVLLNKKESLERCIRQIRLYYAFESGKEFGDDFLKQDAIAINLQRACELCIDMANIIIRRNRLGMPKESRESFQILQKEGIIPEALSRNLVAMVGFRNTLVHQYRELNISIMIDVIENHLDELIDYSTIILKKSH